MLALYFTASIVGLFLDWTRDPVVFDLFGYPGQATTIAIAAQQVCTQGGSEAVLAVFTKQMLVAHG
jgi:hypothetical protein